MTVWSGELRLAVVTTSWRCGTCGSAVTACAGGFDVGEVEAEDGGHGSFVRWGQPIA